jgi:hypothetical protein
MLPLPVDTDFDLGFGLLLFGLDPLVSSVAAD